MMRILFGAAGLLIVLAVIAWLAKAQLGAAGLTSVGAPTAAAEGSDAAQTTPAQRSHRLQEQVRDDVTRALQQTPARSADPSQ